jgi:hypothetical protein
MNICRFLLFVVTIYATNFVHHCHRHGIQRFIKINEQKIAKNCEKLTFELYIVQKIFNKNIISYLDDVFHGNKCVLSILL